MSCLNEERIKNINKSITDMTDSCHDLRMYFNILKNTFNSNFHSSDGSTSIDYLLKTINDNLTKLDNEINFLELNKLKVLKKSVSGKLSESDPYIYTPEMTKSEKINILNESLLSNIISPKENTHLFDSETNSNTDKDTKQNISYNINSIYFDVMQIDQSNPLERKILTDLAFEIISSYVNLTEINIDPTKLKSYIEKCSKFKSKIDQTYITCLAIHTLQDQCLLALILSN
jgi:hypothetical protein